MITLHVFIVAVLVLAVVLAWRDRRRERAEGAEILARANRDIARLKAESQKVISIAEHKPTEIRCEVCSLCKRVVHKYDGSGSNVICHDCARK